MKPHNAIESEQIVETHGLLASWLNNPAFHRRGQIQLFESIAVLMVFFVIVGFALAFYFFIAKAGAQREHARALELNAITTAQKVSSLPELDCIQVGVPLEKCFDTLKMASFSKLLSKPEARDAYFHTIGFANLTLIPIFPTGGTPINLYDNPPGANLSIEKTFLPINTFDPIKKLYGFAVLEVGFYER